MSERYTRRAFLGAAGATAVALACGKPGELEQIAETAQTTPKQNKDLVRRLLEEVGKWNIDRMDELYDSNCVYHPAFLSDPPIEGLKAIKKNVAAYLKFITDFKYTIDHLIAEGDIVIAHYSYSGTYHPQEDPFAQIDTTVTVTSKAVSIFRIENGKIVEEWEYGDTYGNLQKMGYLPENKDLTTGKVKIVEKPKK